jgi:hypothetical protein
VGLAGSAGFDDAVGDQLPGAAHEEGFPPPNERAIASGSSALRDGRARTFPIRPPRVASKRRPDTPPGYRLGRRILRGPRIQPLREPADRRPSRVGSLACATVSGAGVPSVAFRLQIGWADADRSPPHSCWSWGLSPGSRGGRSSGGAGWSRRARWLYRVRAVSHTLLTTPGHPVEGILERCRRSSPRWRRPS